MKSLLVSQLLDFVKKNLDLTRPVLLGYSGGVDSSALLHLLLECKKTISFPLHVVHINHNWREESSQEADVLQKQVEELGLPFHLETISLGKATKNAEEEARNARYKYFHKIAEKIGAQGVFLAHHADDQVETVLKRVFEGSHIRHLQGMKEKSSLQKMTLFRPFLSIEKKDLQAFLSENRHPILVQDSTNQDTKYLRSRFREDILPKLEESFGKKIKGNLLKLSFSALEMEDYLRRKVDPYFRHAHKGVFGICYDLTSFYPLEKVEVSFFVQELFKRHGCFFSFEQREMLVQNLLDFSANCKVPLKGSSEKGEVIVDRGRLFLLEKALPEFSLRGPIDQKEWEEGVWSLSISVNKAERNEVYFPSWQDVWKGRIEIVLPEKMYAWASPKEGLLRVKGKKMTHFWNENKVPAFFRNILPCIVDGQGVAYDFLAGKKGSGDSQEEKTLFISLEIKNIEN